MTDKIDLETCPFCGRNMKYVEIKWAFVWQVCIEHDYDTSILYNPCPMRFYKDIPWRDKSGEVYNEVWVKRQKQQFIESWNRRIGPWEEGNGHKHRVAETIGRYQIHEVYYYDPPEHIYVVWDDFDLVQSPDEFQTMDEAMQFVRKLQEESE